MKKKNSGKTKRKHSAKFPSLNLGYILSFFILILLSISGTAMVLPWYLGKNIVNQITIQRQTEAEKTVLVNEQKAATKSSEQAKSKNTLAVSSEVPGNSLKVPILMYHYIGNNPDPKDRARDSLSVTPDRFHAQMQYLKDNGYNTISLDTMYAALKKITPLPDKPVILTFDDGYVDFYYNAYPLLRAMGFSATVFIPTGLVGDKPYLNWQQIKEMHSSGMVNFGAHTVSHAHLPALPADEAFKELTDSKKRLQDELGAPINFMAYPSGSSSNFIIELTKRAGYVGAVSTWPGTIQSEGTIYSMPRMRVSGFIDLKDFIELL